MLLKNIIGYNTLLMCYKPYESLLNALILFLEIPRRFSQSFSCRTVSSSNIIFPAWWLFNHKADSKKSRGRMLWPSCSVCCVNIFSGTLWTWESSHLYFMLLYISITEHTDIKLQWITQGKGIKSKKVATPTW